MSEPVFLAIKCPTCDKVRYMSSKAYVKGDVPKPSDFVPQDAGTPPPSDNFDAPPLCHECQSLMTPVPVPATAMTDEVSEAAKPPLRLVSSQPRVARSSTSVETLFQPDPDETLVNVFPGSKDGSLVAITTKRIVRISL